MELEGQCAKQVRLDVAVFHLLPCGRIAHEAYSPLMETIASEGCRLELETPVDSAAFRPSIADKIILPPSVTTLSKTDHPGHPGPAEHEDHR